jgi:hypothetical protein
LEDEIMKTVLGVVAAFTAASAATASTVDMLPLMRGVFVPVEVACKGAPNGEIVNYRGGRHSIGGTQIDCTIKKLTVKGTLYTISDVCRDTETGEVIPGSPSEVVVASPTRFEMSGTAYKYCGTKVSF